MTTKPPSSTLALPYAPADGAQDFLRLLQLACDPTVGTPSEQLAALLNLADHQQRLWPLLPRLLTNAQQSGLAAQLPEDTLSRLHESATSAVAAHAVNQHWLLRLIGRFEQAKIRVILLKSSAFNDTLYPGNAPRVGRDIDLLVEERQFERASHLLSEHLRPLILDPNRPATHRSLFERVFRPTEETGPTIELHRGLTNPGIFRISEQALWAASRPHPRFQSEQVRVLSPEDSLLHLAVHAFRDLDFCTHNLVDTYRIVLDWEIDQRRLMQTARRWGAQNVLHCLLSNCAALTQERLLNALSEATGPSRVRRRAMQAILRAHALTTQDDGSAKGRDYRLRQIMAQWIFPDSVSQGLNHQWRYVGMRLADHLSPKSTAGRHP